MHMGLPHSTGVLRRHPSCWAVQQWKVSVHQQSEPIGRNEVPEILLEKTTAS